MTGVGSNVEVSQVIILFRNTNSDSEEEIDTDDEMEPEDYCRKK